MPGRTLVVALVLAWGGAAAAADADGNFVIKGAGTATCATLQKAKAARDERYASIAGWLDGYLSAQNELRGATFDLAPWQQTELLLAAVAGWCKSRPQDTLHTAVFRLIETLQTGRLTERSAMLEVGDDAARVVVYAAIWQRVQQRLKLRGFYDGEVTGAADAPTRKALRAFQAERKLPTTGLPDQQTLALLL
jgi:hypothetical protein